VLHRRCTGDSPPPVYKPARDGCASSAIVYGQAIPTGGTYILRDACTACPSFKWRRHARAHLWQTWRQAAAEFARTPAPELYS